MPKDSRAPRIRKRDHGRLAMKVAACAFSPYKPLVVHMTVTRRCNLACGYCVEYDKISPPVPTGVLEERIDHLADLGAVLLTLTGGEPLLHPDIEHLIRYARSRGLTPVMNSNGYLLNRERVIALGEAGLYAMQMSIDNVRPNQVSKKSLLPLMPKLRALAEHAGFRVRINTVLGSGPPQEAVEVARAVTELGFEAKCSLVRDHSGAVVPLGEAERRAYDQIRDMERKSPFYLSEDFQDALIEGRPLDFKCRAGARFFHVCEHGLVHLCTPRWGDGAKPLLDYGPEQIRAAFHTQKSCAKSCAVAYAHQGSRLDRRRPQQRPPYRVRLPVVA
jgi:MoaA/NifB/PqqE/SkfB family radical SAM enzyme